MASPSRYAESTEVPVERSKRAIEEMLRQRGVEGYHTGWDSLRDVIEFKWKDRLIRFTLRRQKVDDFAFNRGGQHRSEIQKQQAYAQADRQRWRALYLVIRAKIEAVEAELAIFEEEFLAFIVVPGKNQTIGEILVPWIQDGTLGKALLLAKGGTSRAHEAEIVE